MLTKKIAVLTLCLAGAGWLACAGGGPIPDPLDISPAASNLETPIDAVPTSNALSIYFLASEKGSPALFQVAAAGGTPNLIHQGAPFVTPRSLVLSSDDQKIYVADPKGGTQGMGVIYRVTVADGKATPLPTTEGLAPLGLDLVVEGQTDALYFVGGTTADPGVFRFDGASEEVTMVAHGKPMVAPGGVAVSNTGLIYVSDRQGKDAKTAQVFVINGKEITPLSQPYVAGNPPGIALTRSNNEVVLSAINPKTGKSEVVFIDLQTQEQMIYDKVISANDVSGGIHRSRLETTYAWAGKTTVYAIRVRPIDSSTPGGPCDRIRKYNLSSSM